MPYVSKLLERVVADCLMDHLNGHSVHNRFQSAYRVRHSTETVLFLVLNDVVCSAERRLGPSSAVGS